MRKTINLIAMAALAAFFLSGCAVLEAGADLAGFGSQYDLAKQKTRMGVGIAIKNYCVAEGLSVATRKEALAEINAAASPAKMSAFDCDGDGQPDF